MAVRVKICGITKPDQGRAIAQLGANALGFICVPDSPRYVAPLQVRQIVEALPTDRSGQWVCDRVGVFVNADLATIGATVLQGHLNFVQLHGHETPEFCVQLAAQLPAGIEIMKALRIRTAADLDQAATYADWVDMLLLDAYHPNAFGGTGKTLDWQSLQTFRPDCPWFLAGGLAPNNVQAALQVLRPEGIDLSSGVERSPGDKDLAKVAQLFQVLATLGK